MLAPNILNYNFGKARLYFKRHGETGLLDLGESLACELKPEVTMHEEFSGRSGVGLQIGEWEISKKLMGTVALKEYSEENLQIAGFASAIQTAIQTATTLDGTAVTCVNDRYVSVGGALGGLSYKRINIGTVTGGPFDAGETITGTSTKTAKVIDVQTGYLLVIADTGLVLTDTITGGTSTATAAISSIITVTGAIVADAATAATITEVFVQGTDYSFDAIGGLIRELTGSGLTAHAAYLYADVPVKTKKAMYMLASDTISGQLVIIGTTQAGYGPRMRYESWDNNKARLTCTSGIKMITETPEALTFDIKILADTDTYPDAPFGTFTVIS